MIPIQNKKKIAILGAGISGLALAFYLKKKYQDRVALQIFERQNRPGGWIRSVKLDSFFFELGPRAFRSQDSEAAYQLVQELGLESQILRSEIDHRFIYFQKKLEQVPASFKDLFCSPLMKGCFKEVINDLLKRRNMSSDESVYDFFHSRFGPNIVNRFINPLIAGIYAGDPKKLSMRVCFPQIKASRSVIGSALFSKKKEKGLWSLENGLESLIQALVQKTEAELLLERSVKTIEIQGEKICLIDSKGTYIYDHLFSTLSIPQLKPLLNFPLPSLPYTSVAVVQLGFNGQIPYPKGFGYLVPEMAKEPILGVVFDSAIFPHRSAETCFTLMMGGERNPELLAKSDQELVKIAEATLCKHLKIDQKPVVSSIFRAEECIPQFPVGYEKIRDFPNLSFLGTSFSGLSLNQLILAAKEKVATVDLFKNASWHQN